METMTPREILNAIDEGLDEATDLVHADDAASEQALGRIASSVPLQFGAALMLTKLDATTDVSRERDIGHNNPPEAMERFDHEQYERLTEMIRALESKLESVQALPLPVRPTLRSPLRRRMYEFSYHFPDVAAAATFGFIFLVVMNIIAAVSTRFGLAWN